MFDVRSPSAAVASPSAAARSRRGAARVRDHLVVSATAAVLLVCATPAPAFGQQTTDPFPEPIEAEEGVIVVDAVEFASLPDVDGEPARPMKMVHEPASGRYFVSDQWGTLYVVGEDGGTATGYLDVDDSVWDVQVDASGRERGVQSFALHPGFADPASPGHGKLYVWTDTRDTSPEPDYRAGGDEVSHHTVLLEWTAGDPAAATYDGGPPRQLVRFEQPFGNHNGGEIAFDPLAAPGDAGHGLLYVGLADGGSGGDPFDLAGDPGSPFGKILRIDPLGSDGPTGEYGIPADNPFAGEGDDADEDDASDRDDGTLGEIWALGVRNPQHLAWDPATGALFVADIGQNAVEEVSVVTRGAHLGWNEWEGSFRFVDRSGVRADGARADPEMTYPVVEYDHEDPLLAGRVAVTGLVVYRADAIPALEGQLLFGDLANGELFHVDADDLPEGGQAAIRRVLFRHGGNGAAGSASAGEPRTLLELVNDKRWEQEREPAARVDLRLGEGPGGRIFVMNKHDGTIRRLVAGGG